MKLSAKIISLFMALLLACLCLFASCNKADGGTSQPQETTASAEQGQNQDGTSSSSTSDAQPPEEKELVLIKDKASNVSIIRDEDAGNSSMAVACATELRKHIENTTTVSPAISTDWIRDGQEYDHDSVEVLVGLTDYSESIETMQDLAYGEYAVKVVGKKLVVAAYSDEALYEGTKALMKFIEDTATEGNLIIPTDTVLTGSVDEMLNSVPKYENATFSSTYECGGQAMLVIMNDTDVDEYSAYLSQLDKNAEWEKYTYTEYKMSRFATYNSEKYTLNVGYYDYENAARIVIEPLAKPVGLEKDNVYTAVTTSQITMLGLEYVSSSTSEVVTNGQSMLVRLTDGRFIVIDGGFSDNAGAKSGDLLIAELKEQSKDYLKAGEKITIAAWIITHAHGDHYGMLLDQYAKFRSMNIEKFIVNFMSETERIRAINSSSYGKNWGASEGSGWGSLYTAAKALGAEVYDVRVGQVFYFADVKLDILYTIESYAPKVCNALNTTSLTIKFTFDSGDTFLMTGDTTGNGMEIAAKTFGDYLKSDILQVAHHGGSTWGNNSGIMYAYNIVAPETVLWPRGTSTYEKARTSSWNVVLYSKEDGGKNDNFKENLVSGVEGEKVILPIPYTVGSAIEVKLK